MRTGNGAARGARTFAWVVVATLAFSGFGFAPSASADEEPAKEPVGDLSAAEVADLEKAVEAHRVDKDVVALRKDLDDVCAAHKKATDPKARASLNTLLGAILKGANDEGLEKDALKAIGDLGDEDNWKYVRAYCQQPDPKVAPPLIAEALECAGKLKNDDAVPHLLRLVEKSKVYPVAANAMRALGNFGQSRRQRGKILTQMIGAVRRSVPGGPAKGKSDPNTGGYIPPKSASGDDSRWGALSPALVASCNQLTGQTASTAQDWFDLYDRYKKNLNDLFSD
jgi:hypothetical protein